MTRLASRTRIGPRYDRLALCAPALTAMLICLVCSLVLCGTAIAGDGPCRWCQTPSLTAQDRTLCLLGAFEIFGEERFEARKIAECEAQEWKKRSGALSFVISDAFLAMAESKPQAFFEVMASQQRIFDEWLGQLGRRSFTWFQNPPSPLEAKRTRLITALTQARLQGQAVDSLRERLVTRLQEIRPRQVE